MTGLQKVFLGVGVVAIIGLGVIIYRSQYALVMSDDSALRVQEPMKKTQAPVPVSAVVVPSTPETVADDILKEVDADNSTLNEEVLGATSAIEAEGSVVSDFGTIYDANQD